MKQIPKIKGTPGWLLSDKNKKVNKEKKHSYILQEVGRKIINALHFQLSKFLGLKIKYEVILKRFYFKMFSIPLTSINFVHYT